MLLNRFGAALLFTSAAWMLDRGVDYDNLTTLAAVAMGGLVLVNLGYLRFYTIVARRLSWLLEARLSDAVRDVNTFNGRAVLTRPLLAFPFALNLIGTFTPILVAARFPDYRATIFAVGLCVQQFSQRSKRLRY